MSDLIDRQAAIDVAFDTFPDDEYFREQFVKSIEALPSAQPEERTEERTETHACDCISRQAAIDALVNKLDSIDHVPQWVFDELTGVIFELPPVQPEPCEDAVSRKAVANMLDNIEIPRNASWYLYYHQALDRLTKLPSVQPEPHYTDDQIQKMQDLEQAQLNKAFELGRKNAKWIPCSERLPEENMWTICQNDAGAMMIGKYDIEFGWMFPAYFDGTVAWMPIPSPYQEERRTDDEE